MTDQTVSGNLTVTGNVVVSGGTISALNAELQALQADLSGMITGIRNHSSHTANYSVMSGDSRSAYNNLGATVGGSVTFTLPTGSIGLEFEFNQLLGASTSIVIKAATGDHIYLSGVGGSSSGGTATTSSYLGHVMLKFIPGMGWVASEILGSWAVA